jgi:hypothetical protein
MEIAGGVSSQQSQIGFRQLILHREMLFFSDFPEEQIVRDLDVFGLDAQQTAEGLSVDVVATHDRTNKYSDKTPPVKNGKLFIFRKA